MTDVRGTFHVKPAAAHGLGDMSLRLSTVILPYRRWHEGSRSAWARAEELGFHTGYTYDHLSWRSFRDGPWFGAVPTLTAAAAVTDRMRLGTLVTPVKPFSPIAA